MDELTQKPLRVLYITSWGCACGIHTYSANLISELEKLGVRIEIFSDTKNYSSLVKIARETSVDIVHFQHEYGISFPVDSLMSIIGKFQSAGHPVVLTLHTEDDGANVMLDGIPSVVVLHHDKMGLSQKNTFSKFVKIPHGIPEFTFLESKAFYRKKYGIPEDAFVIGTCGFMSPDRGQMLETLLQEMKIHMADHWNLYFHFAMSAHRSDAGGQFANMIRSSLTNIANTGGFADRLQINTEFIPTDEFRERIYTFDLGFSYAKPTVASNSGSAADIVSCGVPVVVNNAPHFSHIAPYCSVVDGDIKDIAYQLFNIYTQTINKTGTADTIEALAPRAAQAIADLGYSGVAKKHQAIYEELVAHHTTARESKPRTKNVVTLNKDRFVSVTMPNSLWQVLLLWTKLQNLVNEGYSIQLLIQNDGMTDIQLLRYMLKGIADIQFVDAGLKQDPRIVRLQSYSLAQNMTVDAEAWLRSGRTYKDLLGFLGEGQPIKLHLGDHAEQAGKALAENTLVIVASENTAKHIADCKYAVGSYPNVAVIGTPLTETWVYEIRDMVERKCDTGYKVKSYIEDTRTCLAMCKHAGTVVAEWGAPALVAAISGVSTVHIVSAQDWQRDLRHALSDIGKVGIALDVVNQTVGADQ